MVRDKGSDVRLIVYAGAEAAGAYGMVIVDSGSRHFLVRLVARGVVGGLGCVMFCLAWLSAFSLRTEGSADLAPITDRLTVVPTRRCPVAITKKGKMHRMHFVGRMRLSACYNAWVKQYARS